MEHGKGREARREDICMVDIIDIMDIMIDMEEYHFGLIYCYLVWNDVKSEVSFQGKRLCQALVSKEIFNLL